MAREFLLSVVAPDKSVVEEDVTSSILPGAEGYFGIFAGHEPVIMALRPGLLEYLDRTNQRHFVYLGGGFAEVTSTRVTVLADDAQRAHEIDLSRAEEDLEDARKALRGEDTTLSKERAVEEVEKAMNRVRAARAVR
jgi:F-type H+-transporting ATPase subunit epsilon